MTHINYQKGIAALEAVIIGLIILIVIIIGFGRSYSFARGPYYYQSFSSAPRTSLGAYSAGYQGSTVRNYSYTYPGSTTTSTSSWSTGSVPGSSYTWSNSYPYEVAGPTGVISTSH
jgi:hypothetical protein